MAEKLTPAVFSEAADAVRRAAQLAHGYKIVEARTPLADIAEDVEEIGEVYARMLNRMARAARRLDETRLRESCTHPPDELHDDRLLADGPPLYLMCSRCQQMICPDAGCHHRIGQHSDNGCQVEGCACGASHK